MSRAYLNSVRRPRITLRTVARDTESALTISLFEIGAPYLADLVHAKHPHPSFPADQAQRKNAHTQVRRGRYWTRKQPFRGSLLQAILQRCPFSDRRSHQVAAAAWDRCDHRRSNFSNWLAEAAVRDQI